MARSKKDKQVVVNQAYFELVERKAQALDEMFDDGMLSVRVDHLKTIDKIEKDWNKVKASNLGGSEPYTPAAAE